MSTDGRDRPPGSSADASPFARWSRLKAEARRREREASAPVATSPHVRPTERPAEVPVTHASPAPVAPVVPNLAELDENSDYSAFLTEGVDAALRRRALRQLFASPKFNVCDGLDTYIDDFRSFPALGGVVTADMHHHVERLAQRCLDDAESAPREVASVAMPSSPDAAAAPPETDTLPSGSEDDRDSRGAA